MATFTVAAAGGFDYLSYFGDFGDPANFFVNYVGLSNKTATQFILKGGAADPNILVRGTGFTYDSDGNVVGGTATSLVIRAGNNAVLVNYTGLSFNAGDLQSAVEASKANGGDLYFRQMLISPLTAINGSNGNDDLRSGNGSENINLRGGDDSIEIGGGNDTINGGDGWDFINYHGNAGFRGINVNLATGQIIDQFGNTDTIQNVEEIGGTALNDRMVATAADDYIRSLDEGRDRIDGGGGFDFLQYFWEQGDRGIVVNLAAGFALDTWGFRDTLISIEEVGGTRFGDSILGNADDNWFEPEDGVDTVDGGAGFDYVSYSSRDGGTGIVADLTAATVIDQYGNTDLVQNIEAVDGTRYNDSFTGNADSNQFRGRNGADSYNGGGGNDEVRYDREDGGAGIVVNLATGTGTDTHGNTETFTNIERIRGSQYADQITGSTANNRFRGLDGNDTMNGGAGTDRVDYSNDESRGGTGAVTVNLGTGTATDGLVQRIRSHRSRKLSERASRTRSSEAMRRTGCPGSMATTH